MSACRNKLEVLDKKLDAAAKGRVLRALWPLNEKEHQQTRILQNDHKIQEREKILDWISTADNESKHNAIRMPRVAGTGEWLTDTEEFKTWRMSVESPSMLWCHGIQGSGKSVMTSLVIDRLRDDHVGQKVAIAFIYFDYRDSESQSLENVVASLLRQVTSQKSILPIPLVELYTKLREQNRKPQIQDLELTLLHVCQDFDQVFIPIDALDECDEAMRRIHFLPFLATLQKTPRIRLFVTSRPFPEDIWKALDPVPQISVQASDADLRKYLRRRIEDSGNADIIDEDFRQRLIETVTKGAQKMFLLPALQIQSIVNEPTIGEMEDAIEAMPHDLHQAFYQTLARIQRQPDGRKRLAMNVLLWISYAHGSLTVAELREAMAVKPGNTSLDPRRRPSQNMMIDCCMGLVTVDRESSSIRLVHYALQEFFRDQREELFPSGDDQIADICIHYLLFDELVRGCCETENEIVRLMTNFPLLRYASSYWGHHVRSSHCHRIHGLTLELLHSPSRRALSIQIQYFSRGLRAEYWEPDEVTSHNAFQYACSFRLESAVCNMFESEDIDIDAATHIGTTALIRAASSGHVDLVKLLMSRGADPTKANWYGSVLHCAAEAGQCESIRYLLDSGVNIDLRDDFGRTPLHCATDQRHIFAIELLLDRGADPNARDHEGIMLIHDAAQTGDERLMRRLLRDERVDISATTVRGQTALHCAAIGGHAKIVCMLLDVGVEIDAKDGGRGSALHLAASWGREDVVRLLAQAGANVNAQSDHESSQELLLEHGAEKGVFGYLMNDSQSAGKDNVTCRYEFEN
ncbi:MAG: hypothetical protein ASARMPREDX12_005515 [Alectoria sarmentosa]|nr:MAG: hypothetical protein ASARMPREDX12_005515 [Alectoria sarmentosa]